MPLLSPAADGTGDGKTAPLTLESSSIADGETDVEIGREIKLVFSKNISNITVKEQNLDCFALTDSTGQLIPIKVVLFDDQLEREKRNDVVIQPELLSKAERYTLTVKSAFKSKNGAALENDLSLTFSTPGYTPPRKFNFKRLLLFALIGGSISTFMGQIYKRRRARQNASD